MKTIQALALTAALASPAVSALPVQWVDWTSGTAGVAGSAAGTLNLGSTTVDVSYRGEIGFIQTSGGTNYWTNPSTYQSSLVDNAPGTPDIVALSRVDSKTLSFSQAVDNVFFAIVSLNGNGYRFNRDFEIVSQGPGYWGNGTLTKQDLGGGLFQLNGSGEPHGVIRFTGAISSVTWDSLTNEYWNGFTVGTYGLAVPPPPVPEPSTWALMAAGLAALGFARRRRG